MKKNQISDEETAHYAWLFLLAHRQLAYVQKQLGPGMNAWQRWRFRARHRQIQRLLNTFLRLKGGTREEAYESVEQDLKYIGGGKQGWSYISVGEIEYLQGLLKGL